MIMPSDKNRPTYKTEEILKAIGEKCPDACILLVNFNPAAGTADVAMAVDPRTAAMFMRAQGRGMCEALGIPEDEDN